jgi:histidinol dehydrogenase
MPIPFVLRKSKQQPADNAKQEVKEGAKPKKREAQATLTSGNGVIMYTFNSQNDTVEGTFVLAQYGGELATETGTKCEGIPGQLAGVYNIVTYTPTNEVFATGKLILVAVGTAGAYNVTYELDATPENLAMLGYTEGTTLIYDAIGYLLPDGIHFTAAWDNNLYVRQVGTEAAEWGYRIFKPT